MRKAVLLTWETTKRTNRLSRYRTTKLGNVGTFKIWENISCQLCSIIVTARLERIGEVWLPIPAPRIWCNTRLRAMKLQCVVKDLCQIGKMSSIIDPESPDMWSLFLVATSKNRSNHISWLLNVNTDGVARMSEAPFLVHIRDCSQKRTLRDRVEKSNQIIVDATQRNFSWRCIVAAIFWL